MTAETPPPPAEIARLIDAQGHEVTAVLTRSGLLAVLTRTVEEGIKSGHPCLNAANARELGDALIAFADGSEK